MEWISVKDRLPEFNYPVFVGKQGDKNSTGIARLESKKENSNGISLDWLEGDSSFHDWYKEVTHWMPLPEPPKNN